MSGTTQAILGEAFSHPLKDPGEVLVVQDSRFTAITGVNTLFNGLMNTRGFDQLDFSAMRISVGVAWRCRARWPSGGSG